MYVYDANSELVTRSDRDDASLVYRVDKFPEKIFDAPKVSVHETTGGVRVHGYATRVGVFPYLQPDGSTLWEFRPPEQVFDHDSLESLKSVAVTINHPNSFVNESNYQRLNHGSVGDFIKIIDNTWIEVKPFIFSKKGKDAIRSGMLELSCGYTSELVKKSGTWKGQRYDCIQTRIRYNHLAIVEKARLGSECKIYLDSTDEFSNKANLNHLAVIDMTKINEQRHDSASAETTSSVKNEQELTTVSLNGTVVSVPHKFADALAEIVTEKQALKIKAEEYSTENTELAQKVADLTAQLADAIDKRSPEEVAENAVRLTADAELVGVHASLSDAIANPLKVIKDILANIAPDYDVSQMSEDALPSSYNAAMSVYRKNQDYATPRNVSDLGHADISNIPTVSKPPNQLHQTGTDKLLEIETNAYQRRKK